jgi:uncharacterized protein
MEDIRTKEIAVVGVSSDPGKYGYKIFESLRREGFKVEGVNPRLKELSGVPVYPSLKDLPEKPDMVITVVPPRVTETVVDEAARLGIRDIWMQPGSESEAAIAKARKQGMHVTFNACFMVSQRLW